MRPILFILLFIPFIVNAQLKEEQLASQYFAALEYTKAADLYEGLLNRKPESIYFYDNLLTCYIQLKQWEDAGKVIRKQQKRFPDNVYFKVDAAWIDDKSGKNQEAKKRMEVLIQQQMSSDEYVHQLASAFQKRNYIDFAIQTYVKARKQNGGNLSLKYAMKLASLYEMSGEFQPMIDEYINAIQVDPGNQETVQEYLQSYMEDSVWYAYTRSTIIKRLRTYPDSEILQSTLIWLLVQKKDFNGAFAQAKALDKRYKEQGQRVMQLGDMALENGAYDAAIQCYSYIRSLGDNNPLYMNAEIKSLDAQYRKVFESGNYSIADMNQLDAAFTTFLNTNGKYPYTASVMKQLAQVYIYRLDRKKEGVTLYQDLLSMQGLNEAYKAECKLELGDIYVLSGDVWEAMLLYGQVDKEFKEHPLGQEAKFRNARLSYYLGEFEWANAQLEVLKTATTQLIANNALELSLLIQDNTVDSNEEPLKYYALADLNTYQMHYAEALLYLDTIKQKYKRHELDDDILFKQAEIYIKQQQYEAAILALEQLLKEYATGIWSDNGLYMLAQLHEKQVKDKQKALAYYTRILVDYPGSFFCTDARKRIRVLRGEQIN